MSNCETCKDKDWCSSEEMDQEECPVKADYIKNEPIKLIQEIEEDGRNVTAEHMEALDLAIKAFEFINENYPKTFIDYLNGEQI